MRLLSFSVIFLSRAFYLHAPVFSLNVMMYYIIFSDYPCVLVNVPTHVVFLNHVVCVNLLNHVCGIRTILSVVLTQVKSRLQRAKWFKPISPFLNLQRDTIQQFPQLYRNILPFILLLIL